MENRDKMLCPRCGERTHSYGGSWCCNYPNCTNSQYHEYVSVKETPWWWSENINVFKDGNMWCATRGDFTNLQESTAGFGETPKLACEDLKREEDN